VVTPAAGKTKAEIGVPNEEKSSHACVNSMHFPLICRGPVGIEWLFIKLAQCFRPATFLLYSDGRTGATEVQVSAILLIEEPERQVS
jgi:hypothetical protein